MIAQLSKEYIRMRPWKVIPRLISYACFEGRPLTTRGQWINPFVFGLFTVLKRLPLSQKIDRPIFIIGTGRSGTTMMGKLLSIHPEVGFLNEPKALWHSIYGKEDVIGNYSRGQASFFLDDTEADAVVRQRAHRLYGAYLAITRAGRVVDKYPELIYRIPFVKAIFPDAKFVFLVRNGWDACSSVETWSARKGVRRDTEVHDWWGADQRKWRLLVDQVVAHDPLLAEHSETIRGFHNHFDMALVEWTVAMGAGLRQAEREPGSIHRVRYEELTSNPEREVSRLVDFCGLAPDAKLVQYACQTLYRREPYDHPAIPSEIEPAFLETMTRLGYDG